MKNLICIICFSLFARANAQSFIDITPTFIGKTLNEIKTLNNKYGNTLLETKDYNPGTERALLELEYKDAKDSISYSFDFKNDSCITFVMWCTNRSLSRVIKKNIERKSNKRFKKQVLIQKAGEKYYVWNYIFGPIEFLFFCSDLK